MKPDRFARVVEGSLVVFEGHKIGVVRPDDAVKLLRAEHRAVVRLVKRELDTRKAEIRCIDDGHCDRDINRPAEVHAIQREMQGLNDLLAALAKRAK